MEFPCAKEETRREDKIHKNLTPQNNYITVYSAGDMFVAPAAESNRQKRFVEKLIIHLTSKSVSANSKAEVVKRYRRSVEEIKEVAQWKQTCPNLTKVLDAALAVQSVFVVLVSLSTEKVSLTFFVFIRNNHMAQDKINELV
ncbi:hypothetical protein C5167_024965 [Papaver somniferum]|uniref:Uncharacterized protein n=1 Tax=Papaver somniferum TaxID=3469 RepID=A0A4Y7JQ15_PAPSO|nr:hypothetical protein C5167_024965 [Papaver somniferum]